MNQHCIICGAGLPEPLFSAENMPAGAQVMPSPEEIAAGNDRGISLSLCRCPVCGLTQFDCEPVTYYKKVIRAVGLSPTMRQLRRDDYRHLIEAYGMGGGKWIECGCGNGDFLQVLREFPVDIYATEADPGNVSAARLQLAAPLPKTDDMGNSAADPCMPGVSEAAVPPDHIMEFFPDRADMDIPGAPFDVFLSFNFLEHQPDPVSMLRCLHRNLAEGGIGLITVPSFEYILQEGRYYELVRDHIANYDLPALVYLCEYCGFEVLEKGYIGIGDTLRVVVKKAAYNSNISKLKDIQRDYFILDKNYNRIKTLIQDYMNRLRTEGRRIAMWGASHQGFTIAATTALKDEVCYIIDSAGFKQGRLSPASHLPIVSPDYYLTHPVDVILIAAPGYIREIEATIRRRYRDTAPGVPKICDLLDLKER